MRFKWKQWVNIKQPLLHCHFSLPVLGRPRHWLGHPRVQKKSKVVAVLPVAVSFFVVISLSFQSKFAAAATDTALQSPSFSCFTRLSIPYNFRQLQSALFEKREPLLDSRSCCLYCCTICKYCTTALESSLALTYVFVDGDAYDTTTQGGYISSRRRKTVKC